MLQSRIVLVVLAAIGLVACSGGEGSGSGASGSSSPPPAAPPPIPTPPLPPVETLTCSPCKKIVFMSEVNTQWEIYSIGVDGTGLTRLTDNDAFDGGPAWSPDGQRIAFTSDRDSDGADLGWPRTDLYVMDADGGNVRRLTTSESGAWNPAWSPDGTRIAYEADSNGSASVSEIPVDGGPPRLLFSSPSVVMQPAWSPDGTRLAIVSDWFAYDFGTDIFLINADGSGITAVTDGKHYDQRDFLEPVWSPDGAAIAVGVTRPRSLLGYATQIGVMNATGSGFRLLPATDGVSDGSHAGTPSWSPDGMMIAYASCGDDGCNVWWIKADGSARGEIVRNARHPDWQR
jgi:Tol biopolymer transport system component